MSSGDERVRASVILVIEGSRYFVQRNRGRGGPRFLLYGPDGAVHGLYAVNGAPSRLRAFRLVVDRAGETALGLYDFFLDDAGVLSARKRIEAPRKPAG